MMGWPDIVIIWTVWAVVFLYMIGLRMSVNWDRILPWRGRDDTSD